jgi:hypothetical protein
VGQALGGWRILAQVQRHSRLLYRTIIIPEQSRCIPSGDCRSLSSLAKHLLPTNVSAKSLTGPLFPERQACLISTYLISLFLNQTWHCHSKLTHTYIAVLPRLQITFLSLHFVYKRSSCPSQQAVNALLYPAPLCP